MGGLLMVRPVYGGQCGPRCEPRHMAPRRYLRGVPQSVSASRRSPDQGRRRARHRRRALRCIAAAVLEALLALPRLTLILQLVAWTFSLAASTFFPLIALGIFWRRANAWGAIFGMLGGLAACVAYMAANFANPQTTLLGPFASLSRRLRDTG